MVTTPVNDWMRNPLYVDSSTELCPVAHRGFQCSLQWSHLMDKNGVTELRPVQKAVWEETIGHGRFKRDICMTSPASLEGSGKTLAYVLVIVKMLSTRRTRDRKLRAVVLLPNSELAVEAKNIFDLWTRDRHLKVGLAAGRTSLTNEISALIKKAKSDGEQPRSKVHILVATPGRLMDIINNSEGFTLRFLDFLVVDESETSFTEPYAEWAPIVCRFANFTNGEPRDFAVGRGFKSRRPPLRVLKMLLVSEIADVERFRLLQLHDPLLLSTSPMVFQLPEQLRSFRLACLSWLKPLYLLALLETLGAEKGIIFVSSVQSGQRLRTFLTSAVHEIKIENFYCCQEDPLRSKALSEFKDGKIRVLICVDGMVRGVDTRGVRFVINYSVPQTAKLYVCRTNRFAAGEIGKVYTFVATDDMSQREKLETLLHEAGNAGCPEFVVPSEALAKNLPYYLAAVDETMADIN